MKYNGFKLAKERSRRYPAQIITDADHADDIALLANTPAQAWNLLHSLERTAAGIGLHVNADMCFNQIGDISILNGTSLKLVDKFIYRGSSVLSTETNIKTRLAKAWSAIDILSVMWKSDQADEIKQSIFQSALVSILLYWYTTWTLTKLWRKNLTAITQECCEQYWTIPRSNTRQSSSCTATYHPSRKLSKLDEPDMRYTAREVMTNS